MVVLLLLRLGGLTLLASETTDDGVGESALKAMDTLDAIEAPLFGADKDCDEPL